jgi:outer membrane immunogenic protein
MTTMTRIVMPLVFATALMATCMAAYAADLAPAPVAIPVYNWTGFYLGINGGYGWGQQNPLGLITNRFDSFDYSINGGMFGGTFGAQIQSGRVVMGLESDIDWSSITGSGVATPTILGVLQPTVSLNSKITSVSTARLRMGYGADNWLFYGTGGLALMGTNANATTVSGASCGSAGILPCSGNPVKGGLALGGGVEWGFAPNWSTKLEYLYIAQIDGVNTQYVNTIRAGINFRFGGN